MTLNLQAVAVELAKYGFDSVAYEYPGYILIHVDGAAWAIGTASGFLGADFYDTIDAMIEGQSPDTSIEIGLDTANINPTDAEIAADIVAAISGEIQTR
jgi:hypothetical protein